MRDTYGTSIVSKYNSDFGEVSPKRLRGDIDLCSYMNHQCLEDEFEKALTLSLPLLRLPNRVGMGGQYHL